MTILSILPTARSTTLTRNLQTWHYQWTWDDLVYIVVAQLLSCVQLCSPMDCSMPGFPVLHYLPEFAQTHNNPTILSSVAPFSACPQSFPASGSFPKSWLFASGVQSIEATASASFLPKNIQDWLPLVLTGLGLISLKSKDSQESSPTLQFKNINSSALNFLYGPNSHICTWLLEKNCSFDYMDCCWQSDISAF